MIKNRVASLGSSRRGTSPFSTDSCVQRRWTKGTVEKEKVPLLRSYETSSWQSSNYERRHLRGASRSARRALLAASPPPPLSSPLPPSALQHRISSHGSSRPPHSRRSFPSTSSTCRRHPCPGSSPGGRPAHAPCPPRPVHLQRCPCDLPPPLLPASLVAGDAVAACYASSRGTAGVFPVWLTSRVSASLAWQAVVVQLSLAVESRGGVRQVAYSRVACSRSFT